MSTLIAVKLALMVMLLGSLFCSPASADKVIRGKKYFGIIKKKIKIKPPNSKKYKNI